MRYGYFDEARAEPPQRSLAEAARRGLGERALVMAVGETVGL